MTDDELSAELDRRAGELGPYSPDVTQALIGLVFAVGHARLGNAARALALSTAGRHLELRLRAWGQAMPTWALKALVARVDEALAGGPLDVALPKNLEVSYTYFGGYPVNAARQLREQLRCLDPVPFDPAVVQPEAVFGVLGSVAEADAALDAQADPRVAVEVLTALVPFSEAEAMPTVARVVALVPRLPGPLLAVRATALRVIAWFGWGELVPQLLPALLDELDGTLLGPAVFAALSTTVRALRRLGAADELRRLIDRVAARLRGPLAPRSLHVAVLEDPEPDVRHREDLRFLLAGAAATLDDRIAIDLLASAAELRISDLAASLVLHRRLAIAAAHDEPRRAVRSLRYLVRQTSRLADQLGPTDRDLPLLLGLIDAHVWAIAMQSIRRG